MTLDEAIFHHKKQGDKNSRDAKWLKEQMAKGNKTPLAEKKIVRCEQEANKHRQYETWLLDYKRLLTKEA